MLSYVNVVTGLAAPMSTTPGIAVSVRASASPSLFSTAGWRSSPGVSGADIEPVALSVGSVVLGALSSSDWQAKRVLGSAPMAASVRPYRTASRRENVVSMAVPSLVTADRGDATSPPPEGQGDARWCLLTDAAADRERPTTTGHRTPNARRDDQADDASGPAAVRAVRLEGQRRNGRRRFHDLDLLEPSCARVPRGTPKAARSCRSGA